MYSDRQETDLRFSCATKMAKNAKGNNICVYIHVGLMIIIYHNIGHTRI